LSSKIFWSLAAALTCAGPAFAQTETRGGQVDALQALSLEELSQLEVMSVSRTPQPLSAAPAAIYVITQQDIHRSGAQTLPEVLRLAPNLTVAQTASGEYDISARGMSGNDAFQNFPNKLLVLIDGRSIYTPLFSGLYWDMQHVPLETVDRIEIISGPGAALWGANAVNGVINIITRSSTETPGAFARVTAGTEHSSAGLSYGGQIDEIVHYRLYADGLWQDDTTNVASPSADDARQRIQAGFRVDVTPSGRDGFVLQGDIYEGRKDQAGTDQEIAGHNLLARWTRSALDGSESSVQGYYDHYQRTNEAQGVLKLDLSTYSLEAQHRLTLWNTHSLVLGGGARIEDYEIAGTQSLFFEPDSRRLNRANFFIQDTVQLTEQFELTAGLKVEDDPFDDVALLPSIRAAWTPSDDFLVWGAVSRAIRSPTPFDRDVQEVVGGVLFLAGDDAFRSEKLVAYELGLRAQPTSASSLSVSFFQHDYDDLRSIELTDVTVFPLLWGNGMEGEARGVEIWGDVDVTPWWRLSASYAYVDTNFAFKADASGIGGIAQAGIDPPHRATVGSSFSFGAINADAQLRYVDALTYSDVPSYIELNGRLAWKLQDGVELALAGRNLLNEEHRERPAPASFVPREIAAELRLSY
jgi:iron complex outermembrane receptor protein